jgi:hypothetical protein
MISIITPTIWNYYPFIDFISCIAELTCVGEIIIINNNKKETPANKELKHKKIKFITPKENIYVNAAWNLGASTAKYNNLCFLSDDVICDLKLFIKANRFLDEYTETKNIGFLSIVPGYGPENMSWMTTSQPKLTNGAINIVPTESFNNHHDKTWGYGSLYFVPKKNYIDIPSELKIYYGDSWQWEAQNLINKKSFWSITNSYYYTPWNVSWRNNDVLKQVIEQDKVVWETMQHRILETYESESYKTRKSV